MLLASLLIIFMLLLVLGVPIAFSMLLSALAAVLLDGSFSSLLFIAQRMLYSIDSMSLLAVPLFIFAGELMGSGGITRRIMHFCNSLVGHVKGGMCHVSILACMIFAGVSGSSNADTAAVASITVPTMRKEGYDDDVAVSCVAAGGTIGPIIPPSTTLLIYATITGDSPGRLLMAGLLPGVLFGLSLMVVSSIYARKRNYPTLTRSSLREVGSSFLQAIPALLAPAIILAGISSGVFTATESGAIAALYGLIVGICYRELNWKEVIRALKNTAMSTGSIMFIIAAAAPFGWVLTRARFPDMLIGFITSISSSLAGTTIVIIAIMLLVGLFMEGMAAMMILVPVLQPLMVGMGYDPIQFGILFLLCISIGAITPPVGICLFTACGVTNTPISRIGKTVYIFALGMLIATLIQAFFPPLTTLVPNLLLGPA